MNWADWWAAGEDRKPWRQQEVERAAMPVGDRTLPRLPRVAFLPSGSHRGGSYHLRGWLIADALRRQHGWDALVIPPSFRAERRAAQLRQFQPQIIVTMRARHPLNNPDWLQGVCPGVPRVLELDDADYARPEERDALEKLCRGSALVLAGSRAVAQWCNQFAPHTEVVWTGTPPPPEAEAAPGTPPEVTEASLPSPLAAARGPVLAWGLTSYSRYGHEFAFARQLLIALRRRRPVTLHLYGMRSPKRYRPELDELRAADVGLKVFPLLPLEEFERSLKSAAVGLQIISPDNPYGEGKSFGKILAYLAAGCVVAASDAADHPLFFRDGQNGVLASSLDEWVNGIDRLLSDPAHCQAVQAAGYADFLKRLTTAAAAKRVDRHLRALLHA